MLLLLLLVVVVGGGVAAASLLPMSASLDAYRENVHTWNDIKALAIMHRSQATYGSPSLLHSLYLSDLTDRGRARLFGSTLLLPGRYVILACCQNVEMMLSKPAIIFIWFHFTSFHLCFSHTHTHGIKHCSIIIICVYTFLNTTFSDILLPFKCIKKEYSIKKNLD